MPKKFFLIFILSLAFSFQPAFARDPYPSYGQRIKYIVAPNTAQQPYDNTITNPQTMMRTNGQRSDIISFSCYNPAASRDKYKYLTDPQIDTLEKATTACQQFNPPYTQIKPPYLKNNKTSSECSGKEYNANCYDWPIGNFLGPHPLAGKGNGSWVTPLVYAAQGGPLNACGPNKNERCDCIFVPYGPNPNNYDPKQYWLQITRTVNGATQKCVAPPYSTSGVWWDWYLSEMEKIKSGKNLNEISSVSVHLGIDGEGRPFKSGEGWGPDPGFNSRYVPAVINEVKKRYPGKTIRANFNRDLNFFLENDLDFHWESLSSDGAEEYLYKGLSPHGYDQIYQNHFFKTNSLGLNPDWPPIYQSVLNALAKHTDLLTGFTDIMDGLYENGRGDFLKFAGSYIGKDINDTPGVWAYLRETTHPKEVGSNKSGKYGDYTFYLYRPEELENNRTVPVSTSELPAGTSQQIYNYRLPLVRYGYPTIDQYVGRKNAPGNSYMSFDVDDGYRYTNKTSSYTIRIVYLDTGNQTFKFQYIDPSNNLKEYPISLTNTNLWAEKTFEITSALFNNNMSGYPYPTDFRLETNGTTIHLVEVRGKENITENTRPKAQVSCSIVQNETDNPLDGIFSVGLNRDIKVKAILIDSSGKTLPNQRIMFTYNSEWNYAQSQKTNNQGTAFYNLNTANQLNRSGFLGADSSSRPDKPSYYSVQVYYPGSRNYQPSRNDCLLSVTNSTGPQDPKNTKIKITNIDTSTVAQVGKAKVTYQVISQNGSVIATKTEDIGKTKTFFAQDPSAQTISLSYVDNTNHASFNNFTLNFNTTGIGDGGGSGALFTPSLSLSKGKNFTTLPHPSRAVLASDIPNPCKITSRQNGFFKTPTTLQEGQKYYITCSQSTTW